MLSCCRNAILVRCVTLMFLVCVVLPAGALAPPTPAADPTPGIYGLNGLCEDCDYWEARDQLATYMRRIEKQRDEADRSGFEPSALADALGPDIDTLFIFVRDSIAYQAYPGGLRLAQGTLMTGAGNSLDQSFLLATMLESQGYATRYAQATLETEEADELLASTNISIAFPARPIEEYDTDNPSDAERIGELASTAEHLLAADLSHELDTLHAQLIEVLAAGGTRLPGLDPQRLVEERREWARRHYWVQVQVDGSWVDLDPSNPVAAAGDAFRAPESVHEAFDGSQVGHGFRVVVKIEQKRDGSALKHTVLDQVVYQTSPVIEASLAFIPDVEGGVYRAMATGTGRDFFGVTPVLRFGANTVSGSSFDLDGNPRSSDERIEQAKAIQKSTGGSFLAGANALGSLISGDTAEPTARDALQRVWLEITRVTPDSDPGATIHRSFASRDTSRESREEQDAALRLELLQALNLLSSGSAITSDYMAARYVDHLLANKELLQTLLKLEHEVDAPNVEAVLSSRTSELALPLFDYLLQRGGLIGGRNSYYYPDVAAYAAEPQLFAMWSSAGELNGAPSAETRFDVMFNELYAFPIEGAAGDHWRAADFLVQQGILDTALEARLLDEAGTRGAAAVFAAARDAATPLSLVTSSDDPTYINLALSASDREAVLRDLEAGYYVVAPTQDVEIDGESISAWWRIHPATMATLGMANAGEGSALTEYAIRIRNAVGVPAVVCFAMQFTPLGEGTVSDWAICTGVGVALGVGSGYALQAGGWKAFGLFNLMACQLLLGLRQLNAPKLGPGGRTAAVTDGVSDSSFGRAAAHATIDLAMCVGFAFLGAKVAQKGGDIWRRWRGLPPRPPPFPDGRFPAPYNRPNPNAPTGDPFAGPNPFRGMPPAPPPPPPPPTRVSLRPPPGSTSSPVLEPVPPTFRANPTASTPTAPAASTPNVNVTPRAPNVAPPGGSAPNITSTPRPPTPSSSSPSPAAPPTTSGPSQSAETIAARAALREAAGRVRTATNPQDLARAKLDLYAAGRQLARTMRADAGF